MQEADFFYVPVYTNLIIIPVTGWADGPYYYAPCMARKWMVSLPVILYKALSSTQSRVRADLPRTVQATGMLEETQRWMQSHYPYWDRKGGRDHIWVGIRLLLRSDDDNRWCYQQVWNDITLFMVSNSLWPTTRVRAGYQTTSGPPSFCPIGGGTISTTPLGPITVSERLAHCY